ncbi:MAG: hypothetical protein IJ584_13750, partial [Bacteroidales bacterium]|nr:hypothetical protein [Bacteroidales bacterium]
VEGSWMKASGDKQDVTHVNRTSPFFSVFESIKENTPQLVRINVDFRKLKFYEVKIFCRGIYQQEVGGIEPYDTKPVKFYVKGVAYVSAESEEEAKKKAEGIELPELDSEDDYWTDCIVEEIKECSPRDEEVFLLWDTSYNEHDIRLMISEGLRCERRDALKDEGKI